MKIILTHSPIECHGAVNHTYGEENEGRKEAAKYLDVSCNLCFNRCQVDERGDEMEIFR